MDVGVQNNLGVGGCGAYKAVFGQLGNQLISVVNFSVIADSVIIAIVGARHGLVAAQDVTDGQTAV